MSQLSEIFPKEHNSLDKNEEKNRSSSIDSLQYSEESTNSHIDINNEIFSENINSLENAKNDLNNYSNYCLFLEKPLDEDVNIFSSKCILENSSLSTGINRSFSGDSSLFSPENTLSSINKSSEESIESSLRPNKKIKLNRCKGCYPIFQENQEGHIGEYGCLGDYYNEFIETLMRR